MLIVLFRPFINKEEEYEYKKIEFWQKIYNGSCSVNYIFCYPEALADANGADLSPI